LTDTGADPRLPPQRPPGAALAALFLPLVVAVVLYVADRI